MNKGELVAALAGSADVTKKQAEAVLSAFMDIVIETVANGEKVTLVGFGVFDKRERQERSGRNPQNGQQLTIKATSVPGFSAGKIFRDRVAGEKSENIAA